MSVLITMHQCLVDQCKTFAMHLHTSLYLFGLSCICFAGNDDCCSSGAQQFFDN